MNETHVTPASQKDGNTLAVVSLVTGIVGLFTCGSASLIGIITGHLSLSRIKKAASKGPTQSRGGLALGGLITSYVTLALGLLISIPILFIGAKAWKTGADRATSIVLIRNQGTEIATYCTSFASTNNGQYPTNLDELVSGGLLSESQWGELKQVELPEGQMHEFIYLGAGIRLSDATNPIILYSSEELPESASQEEPMFGTIRKSGAFELATQSVLQGWLNQ